MRYHVLACDYDGTIATHGEVTAETIKSLEEVRKSGRKLILVTGRELPDLMHIFEHLDLFDRVIAENGGLLYRPATREEAVLAEPVPSEFAQTLMARGAPVSAGRVIVATWSPHENTALELIKEMELELHVIFNKGAVMILPSSVNKATGLAAALGELNLSFHNVVGVGDAENDHAFLSRCECSVAVANALDTLKSRVDWVTPSDHGRGVEEIIVQLVSSDMASLQNHLRQVIPLAYRSDGAPLVVRPYGTNILITGSSGAGKSTTATAFMEGLSDREYQTVVIDPEGDYSTLPNAVVLGDEQRPPNVVEVLDLLAKPALNTVVNLIGLALKERPRFMEELLPRIQSLRAKTGRPHWIVIDEAHHVLPASWDAAGLTVSRESFGLMLITLEPNRVAPAVLSMIDLVLAIGDEPDAMLKIFSGAVQHDPPPGTGSALGQGEALAWFWRSGEAPFRIRTEQPRAERRRHRRKYAEGELPPELSFYFRGPEDKLNLRAQNLAMFLQLADGVDDDTWLFHLQQGHFAQWFLDVIKDPELAAEAHQFEEGQNGIAEESRKHIRAEIEKRYILSAR